MYTQAFSILRHLLPASALLALLCFAAPAQAVTTCVSTDGGLQVALSLGGLQQAPYTIQLVQRDHYTLSGIAQNLSVPTTIEGGYTANCTSRTINAANTIIDFGGPANDVFLEQYKASPTALIKLEGLTLRNGGQMNFSTGGWGQFSDYPGAIRMSHVRITNFSSNNPNPGLPSPIELDSYSADITLEDVQFDHLLQGAISPCAIWLSLDEDSLASLHYVTADLSNANKLCFAVTQSSGHYTAEIYNSIVWSSDGSAVGIATLDETNSRTSFGLKLVNSLYRSGSIGGVASVTTTNPLFTDPLWSLPGSGNYHLAFNSPAVNSGTLLVPGGSPGTDIEGVARIIGGTPDRGASESPFSNLPDFIVTNNSDCSATNCGSLRDAITQSNSNGNASTISFNIPNTVGSPCPHVIGLGSVLPPITSPITINGYSQPGSVQNSDANAFNASLCVLVKPASGTLTTGLRVSTGSTGASLVVRGLGMGGFSQPVLLQDGANHVIAGNQFGGSVAGIGLPGAAFNAVAVSGNATASVIIGGASIVDRNVIGAAAAGVNIQNGTSAPDGCQIINNLVGLGADGTTSIPNSTGIDVSGDGCEIVGNRVANSARGIWINGGNSNVVQRNQVGIDVNGNDATNTESILITGNNNAIGTLANGAVFGAYLGNQIRYLGGNGNSGVHVVGGTGNVVRSNQMQRSGLFSGEGVDIDLGSAGPTLNDPNDGDSGANNLQNFPLVQGLLFTTAHGAAAINVPATISATLNSQSSNNIRIDAYFSDNCTSSGRGGTQQYLGSVTTGIGISVSDVNFTLGVTLPNMQAGSNVSLTATDAAGNTSEIGTCFPLDRIFKDSMEVPTGN
jgi:hypothetical protein